MTNFRNQNGIALLAVIFFMVVIGFVGIVFLSLSFSNTSQAVSEINSSQALYVAEGGLERAKGCLVKKDSPSCATATCALINGPPPLFNNVPLGAGQFTVTSVTNGGQCTLTSTGGVPTIAAGTAQRVASLTVGGQDGWAVGGQRTKNNPVLLHWDGTTWTNQTASAPTGIGSLMGVFMVTSLDGWAVTDNSAPGNLNFIRWNGTAWAKYATTGAAARLAVYGIFMNSSTDGWAIGQFGSAASKQPQTLYWNGTTFLWGDNNSDLGIRQNLNSVYCNSTTDCWAVGDPGTAIQQPLLIHWDSTLTWTQVNTSLSLNFILRSVHCASATYCWAVGDLGTAILYQGLPLTAWTKGTSNVSANLRSVYCNSSSNCWAVGDSATIILWNGMTWSPPVSPVGVTGSPALRTVTCLSTTDCWAGGDSGTLIHWNGSAWTASAQSGVVTTNQINSISITGSAVSTTSSLWKEVPQ